MPAFSTRTYGRAARLMAVGIGATGLLTFAYFSLASHLLGAAQASRLDVLWSAMFVVISVIYRPTEQLLARALAAREAAGEAVLSLRGPALLQLLFAALFLAAVLPLKGTLTAKLLGHSTPLYLILVCGTTCYAASYFARGYLSGRRRYRHYSALVFIEAFSRLLFPLLVAASLLHGELAVATGIAAAPALSLLVLPFALARAQRRAGPRAALSLREGARFASEVSVIMAAEQALLNGAVIAVYATSPNHALPGIVFNVLLIARAPLQLFQAIQTTLLPHLTGLQVQGRGRPFRSAVAATVAVTALFALAAATLLLAVGPTVLNHALFGQRFHYNRFGLALVGVGMGFHLTAGTLNQAALARGQSRGAALCWVVGAAGFLGFMVAPLVKDELFRAEVGYCALTALLSALLFLIYRRHPAPLIAP